jgi:hypothetical protein
VVNEERETHERERSAATVADPNAGYSDRPKRSESSVDEASLGELLLWQEFFRNDPNAFEFFRKLERNRRPEKRRE